MERLADDRSSVKGVVVHSLETTRRSSHVSHAMSEPCRRWRCFNDWFLIEQNGKISPLHRRMMNHHVASSSHLNMVLIHNTENRTCMSTGWHRSNATPLKLGQDERAKASPSLLNIHQCTSGQYAIQLTQNSQACGTRRLNAPIPRLLASLTSVIEEMVQ